MEVDLGMRMSRIGRGDKNLRTKKPKKHNWKTKVRIQKTRANPTVV